MDSSSQSSTFSILFIVFSFTLTHLEKPSWAQIEQYTDCSREKIECGNLNNIGYPFYGLNRPKHCGYPGFELECIDDLHDHHLMISIMRQKFYVIGVDDSSLTLNLARVDYYYDFCPPSLANTTLNFTLFDYVSADENITLYYDCSLAPWPSGSASAQFSCPYYDIGYFSIPNITPNLSSNEIDCKCVVVVPVYQSAFAKDYIGAATVSQAFQSGFGLKWNADNDGCDKCHSKNGECGYDWNTHQFACYSPNESQSNSPSLPKDNKSSHGKKAGIIIGIAVPAAVVLFLGCCGFFILQRRKQQMVNAERREISAPHNGLSPSNGLLLANGSSTASTTTNNSQSVPSYSSSKSDLEKGSTYFGVKAFSYAELEQATNNFDESRELGDGGFGVVYYGELPDGRPVAVKRLFENNFKRVEQFKNEIEILAHLRHRNLVTLYGSSSRRSRELLLVYEYIPNGTVADHLHGKFSESGLLTWPIRLNIAVETADALAYLHASDVIHRDVKTTNILLDKNFEVKVADFGLSRLFPNDVTHVSTAPQGTPGYVDPEYYQVYRLTEKSDVYSFGVVLIELISSKQAVDPFRQRLDINLANMAIDRIQNQALHELVDPRLGFDKDDTVRDVIKSVAELAFQCLQQDRNLRPSMVEVFEGLRGIQKKVSTAEKQVVMDIKEEDNVGLLKNAPPPLSPETVRT